MVGPGGQFPSREYKPSLTPLSSHQQQHSQECFLPLSLFFVTPCVWSLLSPGSRPWCPRHLEPRLDAVSVEAGKRGMRRAPSCLMGQNPPCGQGLRTTSRSPALGPDQASVCVYKQTEAPWEQSDVFKFYNTQYTPLIATDYSCNC